MSENHPRVRVHVNIEVSTTALQNVVTMAKQLNGGVGQMDTADRLSDLISRFLQENDFDRFVRNPDHYR